MAHTTKTPHSGSTDSSISKVITGNDPDRSRLAELYPEPKNYEQRKQDDKLRQQEYRRHWPKYPYLNIATYGSVILGLSIWFIQNLNAWWFGSGDRGVIMATVFFSFAIGIALVFLLIVWVNYVNKLFWYFEGSTRLFWFVYAGLVVALIAFWLRGWLWNYTNIAWITVLTTLHFIAVFCSVRRIVRKVS